MHINQKEKKKHISTIYFNKIASFWSPNIHWEHGFWRQKSCCNPSTVGKFISLCLTFLKYKAGLRRKAILGLEIIFIGFSGFQPYSTIQDLCDLEHVSASLSFGCLISQSGMTITNLSHLVWVPTETVYNSSKGLCTCQLLLFFL